MAHLDVLSRDMETGLDLLSELLFTPAFSGERLKLAKEQTKGGYCAKKRTPARFPSGNSGGHVQGDAAGLIPTVGTVEAIKREDALALHGELLKTPPGSSASSGISIPKR